MFDTLLNPVLNPLLVLGPFWTIIIISLVVSLFTTFIYKYATDQEKLKKLKADLKRYQNKAKVASKDNPEKAMKLQKEMMAINGQYMKASFKSTLYTFIPVLIFFGWLGAHLAFAPLLAGVDFSITAEMQDGISGNLTLNLVDGLIAPVLVSPIVDGVAVWENVSGVDGDYDVSVTHSSSGEQHFIPIKISSYQYLNPVTLISDSEVFSQIVVSHEKLLVFSSIPLLKDLPWIKNWGWLGAYILFSIIFSTSLRKFLKLA